MFRQAQTTFRFQRSARLKIDSDRKSPRLKTDSNRIYFKPGRLKIAPAENRTTHTVSDSELV